MTPLLLISLLFTPAWEVNVTPARHLVLDAISADSLKQNLQKIASDEFEGRGTPSVGLDKAADYIALQFKSAGLKPGVDGSYFQVANYRGSKVRNVIGVLPGSDPTLKNSYVLLTAHYDHLGKRPDGRIFYGADDDGSGTVSVIELAKALAKLPVAPKRSIVFMTFWGEELGMVGSRYYGAHPVFPIASTVADLNLEQIGRTDDVEGARVNAVTITGEDYSEVGQVFELAGKTLNMGVQRHLMFSDMYFGASDNQALADLGVPAHSISTAFEFPDYHAVGDTWDKIDYANMQKVDRLIALATLAIADSSHAPEWSSTNKKATRYRLKRTAHGL